MDIKLNLASKPYLNRQSIRLWLLFSCALMAIFLAWNCFYAYQNYRQVTLIESRLQELDMQASSVPGVPDNYSAESYAAARDEIVLANEIVAADQFHWTALLGRFEELLPSDVIISSIQPNFKERSVQLNCYSRDVSAMTQFVDNLLTSADLSQAFLLNHNDVESQSGDRSLTQVSFSLNIRGAF